MEDTLFRSALFINPINKESEFQIQEIHENSENPNFFSDSFFSGRTPRSGESMNFKNCLSSDLLKRIDEGSPIKSKRSLRKPSDAEEEEVAKDSSHSLFYNNNNQNKEYSAQNQQGVYYLTVNNSSSDEEEAAGESNQIIGDHHASSGFTTVKNGSYMECSMQNPNPNNKKPNNNFNVNVNSNINNITYEEFLRQKYNNLNNNISNLKTTKPYSQNYEEGDYLSNSTLSTLSKKLSPMNDDIAFYPKNFYNSAGAVNNSVIGYGSQGSGLGFNNKVPNSMLGSLSHQNLNYNSHNPNSNSNLNLNLNTNSSRIGTCNFSIKNQSASASTFNLLKNSSSSHNNLTAFTHNNMSNNYNNVNMNLNTLSNQMNNFANPNTYSNYFNAYPNSNLNVIREPSPDYRNPLTLNSNINKIKKNVNLNLNNLAVNNNYMRDPNIESENKSRNNQGKTGWVCSICRNFNYEGKFIFF
jgi:hypothetical protein